MKRTKISSEEEMIEWGRKFAESVAMSDEALLEEYLLSGEVDSDEIRRLIAERKVFPCFFGSALKCEGTDYFLNKIFYYFLNEHIK